ncbi:unnamed protein product [Cuscuta campestris]|uniref:Uncharacterized protein n=1 Tax=Cuscuta campestris TaxID=132261 RepID=A0A484NF05_9ASTE|nr:unnamed protein product [Cuscuta campestris]
MFLLDMLSRKKWTLPPPISIPHKAFLLSTKERLLLSVTLHNSTGPSILSPLSSSLSPFSFPLRRINLQVIQI